MNNDNRRQPVTRDELETALTASEERIVKAVGTTIAASEERTAKAVGKTIAAGEERTIEQVREIETRLLTEFHKWAPTMEKRTRATINTVHSFDERLALLEDRVSAIERGRSNTT